MNRKGKLPRRLGILVLNGGYLTRTPSGGDLHLLNVGRVWACDHDVTYVLPRQVVHLVPMGCGIDTYDSPFPSGTASIVLRYMHRTVQAAIRAAVYEADVVLASSGPFDLLPAFLHRMVFKSVVATYVFHILPPRRIPTTGDAPVAAGRRVREWTARAAERVALRMVRRADVVFVDNSALRDALHKRGVAMSRIAMQRPAVNVAEIRRAVPDPRFQIISIGRVVESKGLRDLIHALRDVNVTAGIIGDGEDRAELTRLVAHFGMQERVRFLGPLESGEMYGLLRGCDLFVSTSHEEGYGIAIAEAIVAGRPVLAYELDHYAEVFNGAIQTVPKDDVTAMSKAIKAFFASPPSPAEVETRAARATILGPEQSAEMEMETIRKVMVTK